MSAKQTKGFRFPEEKCHEVTKGDGRVTLSVWTEGARKECPCGEQKKMQNADPSTAYAVPLPFQGRQAKCKIAGKACGNGKKQSAK